FVDAGTSQGIVLVIDTSGSMAENSKIDAAKAAAHQFVAHKLPNDQIAIVAFSDQPHVLTAFTADGASLDRAIDSLTANGETALWDAVGTGLGLLQQRPDLQPNLVLLSDGKDTVSAIHKPADVQGAAIAAKAT